MMVLSYTASEFGVNEMTLAKWNVRRSQITQQKCDCRVQGGYREAVKSVFHISFLLRVNALQGAAE